MERNLYTEKETLEKYTIVSMEYDINFERPVALSYHQCDKIIIINIYVLYYLYVNA